MHRTGAELMARRKSARRDNLLAMIFNPQPQPQAFQRRERTSATFRASNWMRWRGQVCRGLP